MSNDTSKNNSSDKDSKIHDYEEPIEENLSFEEYYLPDEHTENNIEKVEEEYISSNSEEEKVEKKKPNPLLPLHQFRFGDVAFFISKVELEKLHSKYEEYMDSDENLKGSFVDYILKGVENRD